MELADDKGLPLGVVTMSLRFGHAGVPFVHAVRAFELFVGTLALETQTFDRHRHPEPSFHVQEAAKAARLASPQRKSLHR